MRRPRRRASSGPWQAFVAFLALTAVNPTTVVYFAAVVLGNPDLTDGWDEGRRVRGGRVRGQRLLAAHARPCWARCSGRSVTSRRGRLVTGWVSGLVIAALAVADAARADDRAHRCTHRSRTLRRL